MQFSVPQFIDSEDKIIGSLTLKQFGIVFGTGIIDIIIYKLVGLNVVFYFLALILSLAGLVFAFAPFNGRQLYDNVPLLINFLTKPRTYVFKHVSPDMGNLMNAPKKQDAIVSTNPADNESPQSKLKKLGLLLNQQQQQESDLIDRNYYGK